MRPLLLGAALCALLFFALDRFGEAFFLDTVRAFQINFVAGAALGLLLGLAMPVLAGRARAPTRSAALLAVPGLLVMAAVGSHFGVFFPALDPDLDKVFGSWMLWFYGFTLIGALLVETRARGRTSP